MYIKAQSDQLLSGSAVCSLTTRCHYIQHTGPLKKTKSSLIRAHRILDVFFLLTLRFCPFYFTPASLKLGCNELLRLLKVELLLSRWRFECRSLVFFMWPLNKRRPHVSRDRLSPVFTSAAHRKEKEPSLIFCLWNKPSSFSVAHVFLKTKLSFHQSLKTHFITSDEKPDSR